MTHACARDGGETPAPRKIDEPRQRREAASKRAPWCPDSAGPYRLPGGIRDRLTAALAGFKNREAAFALATWLARFWSAPQKLLSAFPVDRRAIADREDLQLTEGRVRGALDALEKVGFLARCEPDPDRKYQRTAKGPHRRPILFRFAEEYGVAFAKANGRAQAARGAPAPARRPIPRPEPERAPAANVAARTPVPPVQVAHKQNPGEALIMGERRRGETALQLASPLEAALERLRRKMSL